MADVMLRYALQRIIDRAKVKRILRLTDLMPPFMRSSAKYTA